MFNLPNGMVGYFLSETNGVRIDVVPDGIVYNPNEQLTRVQNAVSCFSCHYAGFVKPPEQLATQDLRKEIDANQIGANIILSGGGTLLQRLQGIYLDKDGMNSVIDKDMEAYRQAEQTLGIETGSGPEPITFTMIDYLTEVDLVRASVERVLFETFYAQLRNVVP